MAATHRRNALAATLIAAAAITALGGIAIGADEALFGQSRRAPATAGVVVAEDAASPDEAPPARLPDATSLGLAFDVAAPIGGVTASQDDTTVTVLAAGGRAVTLSLNRDQTYVFTGAARWYLGADKPVAVHSGRDRRVQPIR